MKRKDIIQLGITLALVLVLFVLLMQNSKNKNTKTSAANPAGTIADSLNKGKGVFSQVEERTQNLAADRDPFFKPAAKTSTESSALYLSGIAWDEEHPTAIINGVIVEIGTEIEGHIVIQIKKTKVVLDNGERNVELHLGQ